MRSFYIFIKCELGRTYDVASAIVDTVSETRQVHSVSGEFDLLAQFAVEDDADIGRFVNKSVTNSQPKFISPERFEQPV